MLGEMAGQPRPNHTGTAQCPQLPCWNFLDDAGEGLAGVDTHAGRPSHGGTYMPTFGAD